MADKPTGILVCAILFAFKGLLAVLMGIGILLFGGIIFSIIDTNISAMVAGIMGIIGVVVLIVGVAELVVAYGIWNLKKWARIIGIALAVISLIDFPTGTIIGLIIMYFLLINEETKKSIPINFLDELKI
ncbi:MAG: hypothetical protein CVT89_02090 [Candidatus Altiarchaeales archaeon HGW-Altiarchaeales-2]|nr:MAG: hypothetical protein CVT89_02090 [Candidatus Altiarchaeales archaeon HGW-Altiarchaeales-2]